MPAKNCTLRDGERYNPLTPKLWKAFKKKTGLDIPYLTFRDVIWNTNQLIADAIADEEAGVELPEQMGNIVVTKYKSKKVPTDWVNSKRLGKKIPLLNLHSFGYVHHIKWFKVNMKTQHKFIYRLKPDRKLSRKVAANIKARKKYFEWTDTDFWHDSKLDRSFYKFYKKDNDTTN